MGFKKEIYFCVIASLLIAACGAREGTDHNIAGAISLEQVQGQSLGEPETTESQAIEEQILHSLTVREELDAEPQDFSQLTDEELEAIYREEWEELNSALDVFALTGIITAESVMGAAKSKKGGMSGMSCLGLGIQGEAGGESSAGMVAVGRTLLRRAGGNINKVCSALFARGQFESMQKRNRQVSAASMRAAQESVKQGSWPYDHFINKRLQLRLGRKIPAWVRTFERKGCLTKNVGEHTFYASKNCKR